MATALTATSPSGSETITATTVAPMRMAASIRHNSTTQVSVKSRYSHAFASIRGPTDLASGASGSYNEGMARGWESKSVEAQIESAAGKENKTREPELTPEQLQTLRDKENLELSCTRVKRELASSTNLRYQDILRKALADLESKLAQLEPVKKAKAAVQS